MNHKTIFFFLLVAACSSLFIWGGVSVALGNTHENQCMNHANEIIQNWENTNYNLDEFGEKNEWLFTLMHNDLCMGTEAWTKLQEYKIRP